MSNLTITLTKSLVKTSTGALKMTLSITSNPATLIIVGSDAISLSKLFAIEVLPASSDSTAPIYRFSHVCSISELVEFPEDDPGENCYFRISQIEMIFDNAELAERALSYIKADLKTFKDNYNSLNNMAATTETIVI